MPDADDDCDGVIEAKMVGILISILMYISDDPVNIGDNNDDDDDDSGDDGGDGGRDDVIEAPVVVVDQIAILMYLRPDYYKKPPRHSPSMMPVSRRL